MAAVVRVGATRFATLFPTCINDPFVQRSATICPHVNRFL
ncbi:hypothetical protein ACPOL_0245 [Acidisarcina polymorpha]|uniref:Uncharacterized protein n=1 Tax=Acidisarcina polymorpha TaxID=2211140 RepID=A0A2Z5FS83_9BACT|nr:hypothetical protein ACPOL_0245 [Acidisarcina polymorpha]